MSVVFPTSELNPLTAMIEGPFINDENYIAETAPKQSLHLILKTISCGSRPPFWPNANAKPPNAWLPPCEPGVTAPF